MLVTSTLEKKFDFKDIKTRLSIKLFFLNSIIVESIVKYKFWFKNSSATRHIRTRNLKR